MSKSKDFGLLYKFDYPPYQILSYSDNSFIVCGGGGASKTGVPNKIELYELSKVNSTENLALPTIKLVSSFDTEDKAIMSIRKHFNYLIAAEGDNLSEFLLCESNEEESVDVKDFGENEEESDNVKVSEEDKEVRDRRYNEKEKEVKSGGIKLQLHRQLEPCFSEGCEVTAVRYGDKSGHIIVAAGNKGGVLVLERYHDRHPMQLIMQREFTDVSSGGLPVTDIDISPNQDEIVTVSGRPDWRYARVWSISRGVKVTELALVSPKRRRISIEGAYKFKHCRYARVFASRPSFVLYATHLPVEKVSNKHASCFMSAWGPLDPACGTDYQLIDVVALGNNQPGLGSPGGKMVPTALCASPCGLMAAVGSGEGQVCVYKLDPVLHTLSRIYNLYQAHSFFVTDLTFLPSSRTFKTGHQFELLSVGVDNMLRYHRLPHKPTYLRLERIYQFFSILLVIFFCDRILSLSLF